MKKSATRAAKNIMATQPPCGSRSLEQIVGWDGQRNQRHPINAIQSTSSDVVHGVTTLRRQAMAVSKVLKGGGGEEPLGVVLDLLPDLADGAARGELAGVRAG